MKQVIRAILIAAFILAFGLFIYFFARQRQENLAASLPVAGRTADIAAVGESESAGGGGTSTAQRAKINPGWDETFLDAIDMNLDEDEDLEQVLVIKPSSAQRGKISIVIADFQPTTGGYFRLWKGETLATKPNAVVVQPRDLLGDGSVDLLCFGIDEGNLQTLTIFRRAIPESGAYYRAFSGSGLSIVVEDSVEAESGDTAADIGAGFPSRASLSASGRRVASISVFEAAPGGSSPLDQKKTSYAWIPSGKSFERRSESFVPGENVEQIFISTILTGKPEDFETYLDGLWEKEGATKTVPALLYFDPEGRKISLHSGTEQQQWDWGESNASSAGIYASISNSAVPEMFRLLGIDLVGVDRVRVQAISRQIVKFALKEEWNGIYRRSAGESAAVRGGVLEKAPVDSAFSVGIDGSSAELALKLADLDGFYADENGRRLELLDGDFGFTTESGSFKGYFSFFRLGGSTILDLDLIDDKSIPSGRLSYIVSLRPGKNGSISTLILKPARILSDGVEPLYKPDIVLSKFTD